MFFRGIFRSLAIFLSARHYFKGNVVRAFIETRPSHENLFIELCVLYATSINIIKISSFYIRFVTWGDILSSYLQLRARSVANSS